LCVAFELAKDSQGAQVGYPFPLVNLGAVGESEHLFSGAPLVSSTKQRFDFMMEVETLGPPS